MSDETALAQVKRDVHALCGTFPLYDSRLAAYDAVLGG